MRKRFLILFPLMTILVVLGCATLQQMVQPPDVKVETIQIVDFSFNDITLDFGLLINNPNPFGIALQGYEYTFAVEGKEFLSAHETRGINVGAAGTSTVAIPVTVDFNKIMSLIKQTKNLDSLSFDLAGKLHPGGVLSAFIIPFERSGSLPNVRIPEIGFSGLKIKKMGFTAIDLEIGLNIINKNVFGFDVDALSYDIALAGSHAAKGISDHPATIPAKGKGEIKLPISINLASALGSLRSALSGKSVPAHIEGSAEFKTPFGPITLPFAVEQELTLLR